MPGDVEDADDDALRWGGDDVQAPPLPGGRRAPRPGVHTATGEDDRPAPLVEGVAQSRDVNGGAEHAESDDEEAAQLGNAALVSLGVLGGVYLLFTVGWVIGALRLQQRSSTFVSDPMFVGAFWLAVLAPLAWFFTTYSLTRGRPAWLRFGILVAGAVLLVPWPFLTSGSVAL